MPSAAIRRLIYASPLPPADPTLALCRSSAVQLLRGWTSGHEQWSETSDLAFLFALGAAAAAADVKNRRAGSCRPLSFGGEGLPAHAEQRNARHRQTNLSPGSGASGDMLPLRSRRGSGPSACGVRSSRAWTSILPRFLPSAGGPSATATLVRSHRPT